MSSVGPAAIDRVPDLVKSLFAVVAELEDLFPGRKFTPDGHLVGSLGEVLAAHMYDLKLAKASSEGHDAETSDGRSEKVEIKATQGARVALRAEPNHLIVLELSKDGSMREIYNGPGAIVWARCGPMQKNGQRQISLAQLRKLMDDVPADKRLRRAHSNG